MIELQENYEMRLEEMKRYIQEMKEQQLKEIIITKSENERT